MMKLSIPSRIQAPIKTDRIVSNSLEKNRTKKCESKPITNKKCILTIKSKIKCEPPPIIISVAQQNTEPIKNRKKKQVMQQPQFLKQFEEITKIYQNSQEIENEQEHSLLCLDENLDDSYRPQKKLKSFNSTFNRYSEKSISQLPSIAEKDVEEEPDEEITFYHQKRIHSNLSTASNYQTKTAKNIKDKYINDFDLRLRGGSHQKKLSIDVQNLIKSRSKAKSSMSDQNGKKQKKY